MLLQLSNAICYVVYQAELAEEARLERIKARTRCDKLKIYLVRLVITIVVMGLLAGSIFAIIKAVEVSTDPVRD